MLKFGYRTLNQWSLFAFVISGLSSVTVVTSHHALAQGAHSTAPGTAPAADSTLPAKRFPQPVRVGDLSNRLVLEPSNHQTVLGRVDSVSRDASGRLFLVVRYGGVLGIGTRKIGVPLETTTLLGQFMQIVDIPQDELARLPVFDSAATQALSDNEVVRIGINRN